MNFGRHCVGCLPSTEQPRVCVQEACNPAASVCGAGVLAMVTVFATSDVASFPCEVLCATSTTATLSAFTCRTEFPFNRGSVVVNISGQTSTAALFDYDGLLSPPELDGDTVSPSTCPSTGCTLTLLGRNLASTEVIIRNALYMVVAPVVSSHDSAVTVRSISNRPRRRIVMSMTLCSPPC